MHELRFLSFIANMGVMIILKIGPAPATWSHAHIHSKSSLLLFYIGFSSTLTTFRSFSFSIAIIMKNVWKILVPCCKCVIRTSRATHILFFLIWHRLVISHLKGDITFVLIVHKGGESRVRHMVVNSNQTLLLFVSGGIWGWWEMACAVF